jgi:CcmD family protein
MNVVLEAGIAIYVALAVALTVWIGIFIYLWRLDAQARDLRRKLDQMPERSTTAAPSATLRAQRPTSEQAERTERAPGTQEPQPIHAEQ